MPHCGSYSNKYKKVNKDPKMRKKAFFFYFVKFLYPKPTYIKNFIRIYIHPNDLLHSFIFEICNGSLC